ncbi:hypothetical protein U9M48_013656 [Paspalum notatum var. saurae]|uniref:Uncharacterized protein n=1 Tax=Paspalum notatum var. saurae TaxID=547442 RepID=A0AAQ3T146_PASNO
MVLTSDGTWQQLLRNKYLGAKPLVQVKQDFLHFGTFKIKNGSHLEGQGLKDQYSGLYSITRKKFITIAEALTDTETIFSWRRTLFGSRLVAWNELCSRIANIQLTQEDDTFHWNLIQSGQFFVKSHYQALIKNEVPNLNKRL